MYLSYPFSQKWDQKRILDLRILQSFNKLILEQTWYEDVIWAYTSLTGIDYFTPENSSSGNFEVTVLVHEDGGFAWLESCEKE